VTSRIDYRQFSQEALQAMLALEKYLSSCGFEHKFMRDALARFCPEQRVLAKRSRVAIFLLDHSFLLLGDIISGFAPVGRAA